MKRSRLTTWIVFAGMLLLVAGGGLSEALLSQWRGMSGPLALDTLTVNVDLAADPAGSARLSVREAEKLAEAWERPVAYSARTLSAVSTEARSAEADVIGVGGQTDRFANLWLYSGGSIAGRSVEEHAKVAAVSSQLAEQLFGTRNVVGMTVRLMGATFKIVGVYEPSDSLLGWMTDNGKPDLLVPVTTLIDLNPSLRIDTVRLAAGPASAVSGIEEARAALTALGKPPSRYRIVNYAVEQDWVGQKPKLLLAAAGAAAILLCASLAAGRLKRAVARVRTGLATEDWSDVVRRHRAELAADAAAVVALAVCAAGLWIAIRHRMYIPAEFVPEELIDWSFYRDKWLEWWQQQVGSMGYVASPDELIYERVNMLVGRLTAVGLLIGLPLLGIGIREWAMNGLAVGARLVRLALCAAGAVGATSVLAWCAGIGSEYAVRPRELFVIVGLSVLSALSASAGGRNRYRQNQYNRRSSMNNVEESL